MFIPGPPGPQGPKVCYGLHILLSSVLIDREIFQGDPGPMGYQGPPGKAGEPGAAVNI